MILMDLNEQVDWDFGRALRKARLRRLVSRRVDIEGRTDWLSAVCKRNGFRFCPRLHIALYGNTRGT